MPQKFPSVYWIRLHTYTCTCAPAAVLYYIRARRAYTHTPLHVIPFPLLTCPMAFIHACFWTPSNFVAPNFLNGFFGKKAHYFTPESYMHVHGEWGKLEKLWKQLELIRAYQRVGRDARRHDMKRASKHNELINNRDLPSLLCLVSMVPRCQGDSTMPSQTRRTGRHSVYESPWLCREAWRAQLPCAMRGCPGYTW